MALSRREQLAVCAGFWNGEGCAFSKMGRERIDGSRPLRPHCSIEQVDDEQLYFFATTTGLGSIGINSRRRKPTHQPVFVWNLYGFEGGQALAAMLWFGLSAPKKEQFRRVLQECKQTVDRRRR